MLSIEKPKSNAILSTFLKSTFCTISTKIYGFASISSIVELPSSLYTFFALDTLIPEFF